MIYSFNLNISPKLSYGVLERDIVVTKLHAYDFVIKGSGIEKGRYLCRTLYCKCAYKGGPKPQNLYIKNCIFILT